jgi:hypothetical protein
VIAGVFEEVKNIKDLSHMQLDRNMGVPEDDEMADEVINTTALFSIEDIREATK